MLRKGSFWVGLLSALLILVVLAGAGYAVFRWGYAYGVAQSANWQPPSAGWQPPSAEDLQEWRQQWRQQWCEDDDACLLPFMLRRSYGMMPFGGMQRRSYSMMPFGRFLPFGGFGGFSLIGALFGVVGLALLVLLIIGLVRFAFRPWGAPAHAHSYPPPWTNQPPQSTQPQSPPGEPQQSA